MVEWFLLGDTMADREKEERISQTLCNDVRLRLNYNKTKIMMIKMFNGSKISTNRNSSPVNKILHSSKQTKHFGRVQVSKNKGQNTVKTKSNSRKRSVALPTCFFFT